MEEEDWSEIMTVDVSAGSFAHHQKQTIVLPDQQTLCISATASLSPLDMMDLCLGTNDATGHCIWMGAELWIQALPELTPYFSVQSSPTTVDEKKLCRCLELGSGTGLAGLSAFQYFNERFPMELVLSDNSKSALDLCQWNCRQNGWEDGKLIMSIQVELLDWGSAHNWSNNLQSAENFHIVIATDVIYDISSWIPLLKTTRSSLKEGGFLVVSHVPRAALPTGVKQKAKQSYPMALETFLIQQALDAGFEWRSTLRPRDMHHFERQEVMEDAGAAILIFQNS